MPKGGAASHHAVRREAKRASSATSARRKSQSYGEQSQRQTNTSPKNSGSNGAKLKSSEPSGSPTSLVDEERRKALSQRQASVSKAGTPGGSSGGSMGPNAGKRRSSMGKVTKEQLMKEKLEETGDILPYQSKIRNLYESVPIQVFVAILIFGNFFVSAAEAQIKPSEGSTAFDVFLVFEYFFAIAFTVELVINWYGFWFIPFWLNAWNWFDFVVVVISLLSLALENLPGISVLRLFRAFRVFRLFKRVPSLKIIIEGVLASMPGVTHAFTILGILMGVWSIMGVEFYSESNPDEFEDFIKAMFTMFQMMTMDSWASGVGRRIIFEQGNPWAALFFISYIFVSGIVMTNVVVAILLEKYLQATQNHDKELAQEEDDAQGDPFDESGWDGFEYSGERQGLLSASSESKVLDSVATEDLVSLLVSATTDEALSMVPREGLVDLARQLWLHSATAKTMKQAATRGNFESNKSNVLPKEVKVKESVAADAGNTGSALLDLLKNKQHDEF